MSSSLGRCRHLARAVMVRHHRQGVRASVPTTVNRRSMGIFSKFSETFKRELDKEEQLKQDLEDLEAHAATQKAKEAAGAIGKGATAAKDATVSAAGTVNEEVLKPGVGAAKKVVTPVAETVGAAASKVAEKTSETVEAVRESETYKASAAAADAATKAASETVVAKAMSHTVKATSAALEQETRQREGGYYFDEPPPEVRVHEVKEEDLNTDELGIVVFDTPKSAFEQGLLDLADKTGLKTVVEKSGVGRVVSGVGTAVSKTSEVLDSVSERIWPESEGGEVIRKIRQRDPNFQLYPFISFLKEHVVRQIVQAYLDGDAEFLRKKCGDRAYAFLSHTIADRQKTGKYPDKRILNVTQVEMAKATLAEPDDVPTIVIQFQCQQVNAHYNSKGVLTHGSEDDIQAVFYAWALQPDDKFLDLRWRISEMVIRGQFKLLS